MRNQLSLSTLDRNLDIILHGNTTLYYQKYTNKLNILENLLVRGRFDDAQKLLGAGFDINKQDFLGDSVTHLFYKNLITTPVKISEIVEYLARNGANFRVKNKLGITGNDILVSLYGYKVKDRHSIETISDEGTYCVFYSQTHYYSYYTIEHALSIAELLYKDTNDLNGRFSFALNFIEGSCLNFADYLHVFIKMSAPEMVAKLLEFINWYEVSFDRPRGILARFRTEHGDSLIHLTCRYRSEPHEQAAIILCLKAHGVDINATNSRGERVAIPVIHPVSRSGLYRDNLLNEQVGLITRRSWAKYVLIRSEAEQANLQATALD
jgi:hypothetical protein